MKPVSHDYYAMLIRMNLCDAWLRVTKLCFFLWCLAQGY